MDTASNSLSTSIDQPLTASDSKLGDPLELSGNIVTGLPHDKLSTDENTSVQSKSCLSRAMAGALSVTRVKELLQKQAESLQPWGQFVNTTKFSVPRSIAPAGKRVVKNIERFQSNYLFVFLGLVLFCVLTSPLLLIALAACLGACYIISIKNSDKKLVLLGREFPVAHQYAGVGVLSFPLFWLAGAGSAVFWIIGASFFSIMLHASFYSLEDEKMPFELTMETV